ncbi:hypothetical protein RHA1_ro00780 [Rhodococcus jostii RHA1]|uniref:Uncharacterized protein n=1 Tax=Rhodococcus jostii (strain RHA1) TaxID=101510 RepID=Q0SIM1_RHOJR|nr:hypothetical protein RHA1_ro00780 [Rhodococcus jostii RHA1]
MFGVADAPGSRFGTGSRCARCIAAGLMSRDTCEEYGIFGDGCLVQERSLRMPCAYSCSPRKTSAIVSTARGGMFSACAPCVEMSRCGLGLVGHSSD